MNFILCDKPVFSILSKLFSLGEKLPQTDTDLCILDSAKDSSSF